MLFTARNGSCGKVMPSQVFVCSQGEGVSNIKCVTGHAIPPSGHTHAPGHTQSPASDIWWS